MACAASSGEPSTSISVFGALVLDASVEWLAVLAIVYWRLW